RGDRPRRSARHNKSLNSVGKRRHLQYRVLLSLDGEGYEIRFFARLPRQCLRRRILQGTAPLIQNCSDVAVERPAACLSACPTAEMPASESPRRRRARVDPVETALMPRIIAIALETVRSLMFSLPLVSRAVMLGAAAVATLTLYALF